MLGVLLRMQFTSFPKVWPFDNAPVIVRRSETHVVVMPLRSQITHLFKDVLHGNGRFVMVVNVSPAAEEFNETKRVLQVGIITGRQQAMAGVVSALPTRSQASPQPVHCALDLCRCYQCCGCRRFCYCCCTEQACW